MKCFERIGKDVSPRSAGDHLFWLERSIVLVVFEASIVQSFEVGW